MLVVLVLTHQRGCSVESAASCAARAARGAETSQWTSPFRCPFQTNSLDGPARQELEKESSDVSAVDFLPVTHSLPADMALFNEEYRRNPKATWILKPASKAQARVGCAPCASVLFCATVPLRRTAEASR